jgi:hypothetical protein
MVTTSQLLSSSHNRLAPDIEKYSYKKDIAKSPYQAYSGDPYFGFAQGLKRVERSWPIN